MLLFRAKRRTLKCESCEKIVRFGGTCRVRVNARLTKKPARGKKWKLPRVCRKIAFYGGSARNAGRPLYEIPSFLSLETVTRTYTPRIKRPLQGTTSSGRCISQRVKMLGYHCETFPTRVNVLYCDCSLVFPVVHSGSKKALLQYYWYNYVSIINYK